MNDSDEIEKLHEMFKQIKSLAELGINTDNLSQCRQAMRLICFSAGEYVLNK